MFTIRFTTSRYRPSRVISLRTSRGATDKGWTDVQELGTFEGDHWDFRLDEASFPAGTELKFVLDGTWWASGDNLKMASEPGATYTYDEGAFSFEIENGLTDILVERSAVQQRFFPRVADRVRPWDVIVIGSGMGGGIVANQLAHQNLDVLVLEAGSYLFPEHVANLPRQHQLGRFEKHVWDLWDEFEVRNYSNASGSAYTGGQGYNFGGRSIFWGGLIPRMTERELEAWPGVMRDFLVGGGYDAAEALMNVRPARVSKYQRHVREHLTQQVPDLVFEDAPMAVQATPPGRSRIPAGLFSTADLLMESVLTESQGSDQHLSVNLNHRVERLEAAPDRTVTHVIARDLTADEARVFRGRIVVLAAGPIESPTILQRSGFDDRSGLIGRGLTDHPSFYMHFAIPRYKSGGRTARWFDDRRGAKLLARYGDPQRATLPFNVVVELGADFNQGRYVDRQTFDLHQQRKNDQMLCEIVFMLNIGLVEENWVKVGPPPGDRAVVSMRPSATPQSVRDELDHVSRQIVGALGGVKVASGMPDDAFTLHEAKLGAAGHETGTLRTQRRRTDGQGGDEPGWVVDENLKLRGYPNLYVCDLSIFPVSPAANPSLTLAALAMRLADHLAIVAMR